MAEFKVEQKESCHNLYKLLVSDENILHFHHGEPYGWRYCFIMPLNFLHQPQSRTLSFGSLSMQKRSNPVVVEGFL